MVKSSGLFSPLAFCFSRILPVTSWGAVFMPEVLWLRIGVPDVSGCVVSSGGISSVLQPIGEDGIGVSDRIRSTSRPIMSLSVMSSVSSSSEVVVSAWLFVGPESLLEESYSTTRLYGRFFDGMVGIVVWLVLGSLLLLSCLATSRRKCVSHHSPLLNFPHLRHLLVGRLCSSGFRDVWNFRGFDANFLCITLPSEVVTVCPVSATAVKTLFVLKPHFMEFGLFSFSKNW